MIRSLPLAECSASHRRYSILASTGSRNATCRHSSLGTCHCAGSAGSAFTLIELLVVVAVIAVLAGITLAAMGGAQQKGARDRSAAEVAAIANALERYKMQNDRYPPASGTNLPFSAIEQFMEANPSSISGNILLDPYGAPYNYRMPGTRNIATFDVWSGGATANTNDDIGNW